jgi:hypothetical protein
MGFGTWNIKSLCREGSLARVSKELSKYELDLVGGQEVRWKGGGTETAGEYTSVGTSHMSDIQKTSVASKQLIDFIPR